MPVKTNEREYRRIDVANLETRAEDDGQMIVEGYATTFNQRYLLYAFDDYEVWEEIDRHAFDQADLSDVIMQYDHEGRVFARNKNKTLELLADDHGLHIRARLDGTEIGRQLYEEIQGGYTDKMSFGFTVSKDQRTEERDEETGKTVILRRITDIKKLFDVSAVSLPANDATEISARCFGEGAIAQAAEEIRAAQARSRKRLMIQMILDE